MVLEPFSFRFKFCLPLLDARSGPFIGDLNAHMSNQADMSMMMLGNSLYNPRVCAGGWQAPTSHLTVMRSHHFVLEGAWPWRL